MLSDNSITLEVSQWLTVRAKIVDNVARKYYNIFIHPISNGIINKNIGDYVTVEFVHQTAWDAQDCDFKPAVNIVWNDYVMPYVTPLPVFLCCNCKGKINE